MSPNYLAIHQYRLDKLFSLIQSLKIPPKARVLDLGCYPDFLLKKLKKSGYESYGVASVQESMSQKNIDILNLETDNLPYKSNYFDLIILSEVVEHLGTGINHLYSEVTRCLKPSGFFIVTTPNVLRLHNLFSLIIGKNIYFPLFQLEQPHNFRHQREYALSELISFAPKNLLVSQSQYLIAYPPFRRKVSQEPFFTRLSKWLLYFLLLIFPSRRDTLVVVFRKK